MLLAPLLRRNNARGILEVFSTRPRAFDDSDEQVLELLAVIASMALADFAENESSARVARSAATGARPVSIPAPPV